MKIIVMDGENVIQKDIAEKILNPLVVRMPESTRLPVTARMPEYARIFKLRTAKQFHPITTIVLFDNNTEVPMASVKS